MQDDNGRKTSTDTTPDSDGPLDEIKLPPYAPTEGRRIDDPGSRRKQNADATARGDLLEEDDDKTGEMDSAGQDLGLPTDAEQRVAASTEDSGMEDEESDFIDQDDNTDKGAGQFD